MKYTISTTVRADSKEEALEKLTNKMELANEEFQIDCGNPPDLDWARKAGLSIKKTPDAYAFKLSLRLYDDKGAPYGYTSVAFTTEKLAKLALRLGFIAMASGSSNTFHSEKYKSIGLLNKENTDIDKARCDGIISINLNDEAGSIFFDYCENSFELSISRCKIKNLSKEPKAEISSQLFEKNNAVIITDKVIEIEKNFAKNIYYNAREENKNAK